MPAGIAAERSISNSRYNICSLFVSSKKKNALCLYSTLRYGHVKISSDMRLPEMVREFVKKAVEDTK